jgi:hypothetical protein
MERKTDMQPKAVVLAAYEAANRGQHSKANAFVAPEVRKGLVRSRAMVVASGKRIRNVLRQLEGRRDQTAARGRKTLRALIKSNQRLAAVMGSPRLLSNLWNGATRRHSLVTIEATRQVIRGSRARVHLRLTLRDGTVVKDSEPLVLRRGKWLLG